MAKKFAFEDVINSIKECTDDDKKREVIIKHLVETHVLNEKDDGTYSVNVGAANALLKSIRKTSRDEIGLPKGTKPCAERYLDGILNDFYEHPNIKDEFSPEELKECFEFLTARPGKSVSTSYDSEYSLENVYRKINMLRDYTAKLDSAKAVDATVTADEVAGLVGDALMICDGVHLINMSSKTVHNDLVVRGANTYDNVDILIEGYNTYIQDPDHAPIDEIENFLAEIGATKDATTGAYATTWGDSFKGFVDFEKASKKRISPATIKKLRNKLSGELVHVDGPADSLSVDAGDGAGGSTSDVLPPSSLTRALYTPKRRGFFEKVGRWMAKHPILTSVIAFGVVATGAMIINPVATLSVIGTGLVVGAGVIAGTSIGKGIVYASSPRYRDFCYNYDIEKDMMKVIKNRVIYENVINRVKARVDGPTFDEICNARDTEAKTAELLDAGRIDINTTTIVSAIVNDRERRKMAILSGKNTRKLAKIADMIDKRKENAVDMGMVEEADRDTLVEDVKNALDYETSKAMMDGRETSAIDGIRASHRSRTTTPPTGTSLRRDGSDGRGR